MNPLPLMNPFPMSPIPSLFHATVASAFDAGATVAVHLRGVPDRRFQGCVQDVTDDAFVLYHAGSGEGWRWAFQFADVVAVGLLTPLPADLTSAACTHQRP